MTAEPTPVEPSLLADLADPETHEPVRLLDAEGLASLRARVAAGTAARADGAPVPPFDAAFVSQGGRVAYLVVDGLPVFLLDDRLHLDPPLDT